MQGCQAPFEHLLPGFAARRPEEPARRLLLPQRFRLAGLQLGKRHAVPHSPVLLPEPFVRVNGQLERPVEQLRCFPGAAQVAADNPLPGQVMQLPAPAPGHPAADGGKRAVQPALDSLLFIPPGLGMADEAEAGCPGPGRFHVRFTFGHGRQQPGPGFFPVADSSVQGRAARGCSRRPGGPSVGGSPYRPAAWQRPGQRRPGRKGA